MNLPPDIASRIKLDFKNQSGEALNLLNDLYQDAGSRLIRSVIFLSNGSLEDLKKNVEIANIDFRDILVQAEYEDSENIFENQPKRIRDFTKPFEK